MDVRDLIKRSGLSISELSARTGIGDSYLKLLSSGRRGAGAEIAPKLAEVFRARAVELVENARIVSEGADALLALRAASPAGELEAENQRLRAELARVTAAPSPVARAPFTKADQLGRKSGRGKGEGGGAVGR
jgi:transcriptional regulator with XRE-family HTH domain